MMRRLDKMSPITRFLQAAIAAGLLTGCQQGPIASRDYEPHDGDVIFQSFPLNPLTATIESVTQSGLSHCGIVHRKGSQWIVLEAVGPVKETPLAEWTSRGRNGRYAAFRLKPEYQPQIPEFLKAAYAYSGRHYDIHYQFGDDAIYCSELVYNSFKSATGEDLGRVQKLGELNWRPNVEFIKGIENGTVPLDRRMITPIAVARASQLDLVFSNYESRK